MSHRRIAVVVGIDHYTHLFELHGCVNDAIGVAEVLSRHADGRKNFKVTKIFGSKGSMAITRVALKRAVTELFVDDPEVALFYFAGHGHIEATGGYLCAGDSEVGDAGLPLADIMTLASTSPAKNKIIVLDSCHSGIAGSHPVKSAISEIADGTTILTASTKDQYATEKDGSGVFTGLMIDALKGAACDLLGNVTPGSVYAHVDESLGASGQRPVFKTNIKQFVSLRNVVPPIPFQDLQQIATLFPTHGHVYPLNPTFEPTSPTADPQNTKIFKVLQKYNRVNLAVPVDVEHPYDAAMGSTGMRLTATGEHYRRLRQDDIF